MTKPLDVGKVLVERLKRFTENMETKLMTKPIILTDEEIETIKEMLYLIETKHEDYGKEAYYLRNLLERTKENE